MLDLLCFYSGVDGNWELRERVRRVRYVVDMMRRSEYSQSVDDDEGMTCEQAYILTCAWRAAAKVRFAESCGLNELPPS